MAFPTTSILDSFTRANEGPPPSSSWTNSWLGSGLIVSSNIVTNNSDGNNRGGYWNVATFGADCEVYATIAVIDEFSFFRYWELQARLANPTNASTVDGYAIRIRDDSGGSGIASRTTYYRIDNGVYTALGADYTGITWADGDKLGLEIVGSTLQAYVNDGGAGWTTLTTSRTDSTYSAAGYIGIGTNCGLNKVNADDFGGGTISSGAFTLTADAGSYVITGTAAGLLLARKVVGDAGSYTLSGTDASLLFGREIAADSGSYLITGTDATLLYSGSGNKTLAADPGSYSITGTNAALLLNRLLTAEAGVYAVSGQTVNLLRSYLLTADGGSYAVNGTAANFLRTYLLNAEAGVYTIQGQTAELVYSAAPTPSGDFLIFLRRRRRHDF